MNVEWAIIAGVVGVCSFGLSFAIFWFNFGTRLSKAESEASSAARAATTANAVIKAETDRLNERLILLGTSFSHYREQVAKEYISRDVAREMEDRLTMAIERLGDRFDKFFEAIARK